MTEADWSTWQTGDLAPAVAVAFDAFGPQRLMFGSDWPVCLLAATYREVVTSAEELLAGLSDEERRAIFEGTARSAYQL